MNPLQAFAQMVTALNELAPIINTYYKALIAEGFTKQQAFELTKAFQEFIIRGGVK